LEVVLLIKFRLVAIDPVLLQLSQQLSYLLLVPSGLGAISDPFPDKMSLWPVNRNSKKEQKNDSSFSWLFRLVALFCQVPFAR
jgi:hypothetical protein